MEQSKINSTSNMEFGIVLRLTEKEAKALNAITVYGTKAFLGAFYKELGENYLKPNEAGVESLFETIKNELPNHIKKFDKCRELWISESTKNLNK